MGSQSFRAGFGRVEITPRLGCRLMGFSNRTHGATAVHDGLLARALVLSDAGTTCAIVACELRCVNEETTAEVRQAVARRVGIPGQNVFLCATHTHSGPHDRDGENWERPLAEVVTDAVEMAIANLQEARLGGGFGMLYGYSINRRWIDRPVDPAVGVVRIEDAGGVPLGILCTFGCHPVVLGYDNYAISADWPGHACRVVEQTLGAGTTCMFLIGGAGDVNPVVAGVRQQLRSGQPVTSIGGISAYYGTPGDGVSYNIGDRQGGTFEEVAELGEAFAQEVLHVQRGIHPSDGFGPLWIQQRSVDASPTIDVTKPEVVPSSLIYEVQVLGIGDVMVVGQPGEIFAETAVRLRTYLRGRGVQTPLIVGHANGWRSYLPEASAFPEGGYEVMRARAEGTSPEFQTRVRSALEKLLAEGMSTSVGAAE